MVYFAESVHWHPLVVKPAYCRSICLSLTMVLIFYFIFLMLGAVSASELQMSVFIKSGRLCVL